MVNTQGKLTLGKCLILWSHHGLWM